MAKRDDHHRQPRHSAFRARQRGEPKDVVVECAKVGYRPLRRTSRDATLPKAPIEVDCKSSSRRRNELRSTVYGRLSRQRNRIASAAMNRASSLEPCSAFAAVA